MSTGSTQFVLVLVLLLLLRVSCVSCLRSSSHSATNCHCKREMIKIDLQVQKTTSPLRRYSDNQLALSSAHRVPRLGECVQPAKAANPYIHVPLYIVIPSSSIPSTVGSTQPYTPPELKIVAKATHHDVTRAPSLAKPTPVLWRESYEINQHVCHQGRAEN